MKVNPYHDIKIIPFFLLFLLPSSLAAQAVISLYDELAPLYPDSRIDKPVKQYSVHVARGTVAAVHLLITDIDPGNTLSFTVTGGDKTLMSTDHWYRMIDVEVTENTGLDSRTEKFSGQKNLYVIRRAPFRIYEAFEPVTSPMILQSSAVALRLEIPMDSSVTPGKKDFALTVSLGKRTERLMFSIAVHNAIVPPTSHATIGYVNWHTLDNICRDYGVEKWSESFWDILRRFAQLMARGRQNTFRFLWYDFFSFDDEGNVTEFSRDHLERYIETFLNEGLQTIQGAPFTRRRDWSSNAMLVCGDLPYEIAAVSDKGKKIIAQMFRSIIEMMQEHRWEDRWLQGVFDEPTDEYVDRYKELITLLREWKPDVKIMEATMTQQLVGVVDHWCPQVQEYQAHQEFFDARKQAGDNVWVYTCLVPGGPWINRLVDQERLRQVYVGWACAKYDLYGFLHWGLNFNTTKPFDELVREHGGPTNFLPAGDSHIIYPGKDGPLSSQRFEAHRIGMEDYELLRQLKRNDLTKMQTIIAKLFQAFDEYSKDIMFYRKVKQELLEKLDTILTDL
ncbi:MAG: DUF4091 domain-containing protein [bacterium]